MSSAGVSMMVNAVAVHALKSPPIRGSLHQGEAGLRAEESHSACFPQTLI